MGEITVWTARAHRLLGPVTAEIGRLHALGTPCILLVPEQLTLQAERELLDRLHLPGFFTIEALSPSRLSQRVLAAAGADGREPLTSAGRQMAVHYALERCEKKLEFYQAAARRRGFAPKVAALLTDCKRGGLTPERLAVFAETLPEGMRRAKLRDVVTLYTAYREVLGERFGDSDDQLRYVARRLPESGVVQGQAVFAYGFDALPAQLIELLCAVGACCECLTVALTCDAQAAPDGDLYDPVRQSIRRFADALAAQGLPLAVRALPAEALGHAPALDHLDAALFAYPEQRFAGTQASVFLSQHLSPHEEATYAARQILRLCAEGMDPERIAVLYPDRNGYAFAVNAALGDSGLPYYTDEKLPAMSHALARFLLAALDAIAADYEREAVLAVLKSGYAPLDFNEACTLENYARAYGINRKKWLSPFRLGGDELAARCEALRLRLIEPLQKARAAIVAARDTRASLAAVMGLLQEVHAYDTLRAEEDALLDAGLTVRAGQNSQMWQAVLSLLDQLYALSDGARIPLNQIRERFACGLTALELGTLPPASHMVHAGTLGHALPGALDAVFLLGLNDGVLSRAADSLLTDDERRDAERSTGTYLGMTDESRAQFARLDLKRAMTQPERYLFLSYAKTDPMGAALRPLDLLNPLQTRLFDGLPEAPVPEAALPLSAVQALAMLSGVLRAYADGDVAALPPIWQERLAKLLSSQQTAYATARLLRAADYRVQSVPLEPAAARALFPDRTLSVSRLEEFAACPYKHFVAYGLRPLIRREWGVEPVDLGVFFHRSLQNFATLANRQPDYPRVDDAQAEAMADEAVQPLVEALLRGPMGDNARGLAGFERAKRIVRRACLTVTRHLAAGDFTLDRAEALFGYARPDSLPAVPLRLADGTRVDLQGKIDRIDRCDAAGTTYLRVVDYKSGLATLEPAKTWWGLQLQLTVYLDAAVAGTPGAVPAGAFYFHVADPLAPMEQDDPAAAEEAIARRLRLKGVLLADEVALQAMDASDTGVAIGTTFKREGGLRKDARTLDLPQMQALLRHAREQASALAEALYGGDTAVLPVQSGNVASCAHCDYPLVCGFDPDARGAALRELPPLTLEELRERLEGPDGAAEPLSATGAPEAPPEGGEDGAAPAEGETDGDGA